MVFSKKRLRGAGMFVSFGQAKEPSRIQNIGYETKSISASSPKANELNIKIISVLLPHTQRLQPPLWLLTW